MSPGILDERADFFSVLEAFYAPEPDFQRWTHAALSATASMVRHLVTPVAGILAHRDDYAEPAAIAVATHGGDMDRLAAGLDDDLAAMDGASFRATYYPGAPVGSYRELEALVPPQTRDILQTYREGLRASDGTVVFAYPEPGLVVVFSCWVDQPLRWSPVERRRLARLAGHLDAAVRLRLRPSATVAAVVSPQGKLLDVDDVATLAQRDRVAATVIDIERTRLRRHRHEPDAIEHWQALIGGRYSVVPRDDSDGRRHYLLLTNAPTVEPHAKFSVREVDVVRLAARGFTGKGIAHALGLTPAVVSTALGNAATKVGLRSRTELVAVVGPMFGAGGPELDVAALTPAESEVLALLRRGMSNDDIARLRARSRHTVANQIASILQKTGSPSRRALAMLPDDSRRNR